MNRIHPSLGRHQHQRRPGPRGRGGGPGESDPVAHGGKAQISKVDRQSRDHNGNGKKDHSGKDHSNGSKDHNGKNHK